MLIVTLNSHYVNRLSGYLHVYTVHVHVNAHTTAAINEKKTKKKIVILHLYCSYSVASTKNERKEWLAIPDADADASHH